MVEIISLSCNKETKLAAKKLIDSGINLSRFVSNIILKKAQEIEDNETKTKTQTN